MKVTIKKALLATTAIFGLAVAATPAQAFDEANWTWTKDVNETVDIDIDVLAELNPTGHVEIEKIQTMEGDVRAEAIFMGDYMSDDATNLTINQDLIDELNEDKEVDITGVFNVHGTYDANANGPNILTAEVSGEESLGLGNDSITVEDNSKISVQPSNYELHFAVDGTVTVPGADIDLDDLIDEDGTTLDAATELGVLQGDATAIANYQALQTETATFLDEVQNHIAANEDGFGVEAIAMAGDAENPVAAAVDLNATAISNFMTIEGATDDPNNILIANIEQTTNANVLASATAVQDLSGFNNLGGFAGLDADMGGLVGRLSATAIGNYASLSFGPNVDLNMDEEDND